jgi:hypothetical protein
MQVSTFVGPERHGFGKGYFPFARGWGAEEGCAVGAGLAKVVIIVHIQYGRRLAYHDWMA